MEIKSNLSPEFVEEKLARPESIPFFDLPAKMRAAWSQTLAAVSLACSLAMAASLWCGLPASYSQAAR